MSSGPAWSAEICELGRRDPGEAGSYKWGLQGSGTMVPEGWYLVQHCANGKGTGTKLISVGTNKKFVHGCFWNS